MNPPTPIFIQIHRIELWGMYCQKTKKLMSGNCHRSQELLTESDSEQLVRANGVPDVVCLDLAVQVGVPVLLAQLSGRDHGLDGLRAEADPPVEFQNAARVERRRARQRRA